MTNSLSLSSFLALASPRLGPPRTAAVLHAHGCDLILENLYHSYQAPVALFPLTRISAPTLYPLGLLPVLSSSIVATLGLSVLTAPYSTPLHSPKLSPYPADPRYLLSSLSHTTRETPGDTERGGPRSCPNPQPIPGDSSMSQESPRAGPLSDDASQTEDRSVIEEHASVGPRGPSRRPPLRARPQSWHPYGPVEPPLDSSASRTIGVHAILNPASKAAAESGTSSGRHSRGLPGPSSPRPRQGSSPTPRAIHPLAQQPLSPRSHSRHLTNPGSPSARFVGGGGRASGQSSVIHSPLIAQDPHLGLRQPASSSPLPMDSTLRPVNTLPSTLPSTQPPPTALHSTSSLHSRHASTGPGPLTNPNSQETSPTTPHSGYGHFGRASPAVTNVSLPPTPALYPPTAPTPGPYMTIESASRGIPAPAGPRSSTEDTAASTNTPGMIPCVLDLKSGSTSQAEKRKANSDASRRFRNRKRNEMQLEQRLSTQQDEIRRQSDEIRALLQRVDHYRSERDFYRDHLGRSVSLNSLPPRPPSPRSTHPAVLSPVESVVPAWPGTDASRAPQGSQSIAPAPPGRLLDSARPQASWPGTPAPYSPAPSSRGLAPPVPPPVAGGPLPPFQGSWARS